MKKNRRGSRTPRLRRALLSVEACEPRRLLATFVVTTAADNGDDTNPTPGSLRAAILLSNASPAPTGQTNLIDFDINGTSTITPVGTVLPEISASTVVDGLTQPNTPVVLDGINFDGTNGGEPGLTLINGNMTIEGLTIDRFPGPGIVLIAPGQEKILDNHIGTDATGETTASSTGQSLGNGESGIFMNPGGSSLIQGNVISGNDGNGIDVLGEGNLIVGNEIGTDATGTKALPNIETPPNTALPIQPGDGIILEGFDNTVGGTTAGDANIISGNQGAGLSIEESDNLIEGNKIGTDVTGTRPLANAVGVTVDAAANTDGGTASGSGNIISGNIGDGVHDVEEFTGMFAPANLIAGNTIDSNGGNGIEAIGGANVGPLTIQRNLIGTNAQGASGLGNTSNGILINGLADVLVLNNVISGSRNGSGILDDVGEGADIEGDLIGTDPTGTLNLGNHGDGITLDGSFNVRVYGSVIVGSVTGCGVSEEAIGSTSPGSPVQVSLIQDHIGVNLAGTAAIPNAEDGIQLRSGQTAVIQADLISGNRGVGVNVEGPPGVVIESSLIGTNAAGTAAIPNLAGGVSVVGSTNLHVFSNVISGNQGVGLTVDSSTSLLVTGNEIGTNKAGTGGLGNVGGGALINGSTGDIAMNTISANTATGVATSGDGLDLTGSIDPNSTTPEALLVINNQIGTDEAAQHALANQGVGIRIGAVSGVTISGNLVSGNDGAGIEADGSYGVQIDGNLIGTGRTSTQVLPNGGDGIDLEQTALTSVVGNHVVNNQVNGIAVEGEPVGMVTNAYLADNYVGTLPVAPSGVATGFGNLGNGILISGASAVDLISNLVVSNGLAGISATQSSSLYVEYNDVGTTQAGTLGLGNSADGIDLSSVTFALVLDNSIFNNGGQGLNLTNSNSVTLEGNNTLTGMSDD